MINATIIADASWCPDTKVGGCACWVNAGARGSRSDQQMLKDGAVSSTSAEMKAVAIALHFAMKSGLITTGDRVLIQTDCVGAIEGFKGSRNNISAEEKSVAKWVKTFQLRYGLEIMFKHVKGHTTNEGARYRSNVICDTKAKQEMRRARDLFKVNQLRQIVKVK